MFDRRLVMNFDVFLLVAVLALSCLGVLNLKSICFSGGIQLSPYFYKQIYWIIISLFFLFIIININYASIIRYSYYLHFLSLLLLLAVIFIGKMKYGSQRWIYLGPVSLQPSEIAKITFILSLAKYYTENMTQKPFLIKDLIYPVFLLFSTFLLIYLQPDLGTAGIVMLIFISMTFFINIYKKSLVYILLFCFFSVPSFWFLLKDYQKNRILTFFNPELDPLNAGYQIIQSKIAVGSGGLFGKGFNLGTQSQLRFLPEQHTDFVFSVWAEEWGFLGCFLILFLFFFIIYRGLSISFDSRNIAGSFIAIGVSFLLFWQVIINILMTIGLFPVVGVPLPFFSYGGSSMLSCMIGVSLLLNIRMRKIM